MKQRPKKSTSSRGRSFKKLLKAVLLGMGKFSLTVRTKKILWLVVVLAVLFFGYVYAKDAVAQYALENIVVSEGEIIKRIKTHTSVPEGEPVSIVRVQDAESLRSQHIFYKDVKEGNYIVVYTSKVIIYDLRADRIVAEKNGVQ